MPNDQPSRTLTFRPEFTIGTLLLLATMLGSLGVIVWQGGALRASLELGIRAEHDLRETENRAIHDDLAVLRSDIRDLRTTLVDARNEKARAN